MQKACVHAYTDVSICTDAHIIKWSPDGEEYVTVITNKVDIYKLDTASITGTITTEKRISSLRFITVSWKQKGDGKLAGLKHMKLIAFFSPPLQGFYPCHSWRWRNYKVLQLWLSKMPMWIQSSWKQVFCICLLFKYLWQCWVLSKVQWLIMFSIIYFWYCFSVEH